MPLKKDSLFYDVFNIFQPWEIILVSVSKEHLCVEFKLDYNSDTVNCPICSRDAAVVGKSKYTWKYLDLFEYSTLITAYVPLVGIHSYSCKSIHNHNVASNLLLLDLIIRQQKNTKILNPLRYLFKAVESAFQLDPSASTTAA